MDPVADKHILRLVDGLGTVTRDRATRRVTNIAYTRGECLPALQRLGDLLIEEQETINEVRFDEDGYENRNAYARAVFERVCGWRVPSTVLMPLFLAVPDDDTWMLGRIVWLFSFLLVPPPVNATERTKNYRLVAETRALFAHKQPLFKIRNLVVRLLQQRKEGRRLTKADGDLVTGLLELVVGLLRLPDLPSEDGLGMSDNLFDKLVASFFDAQVLLALKVLLQQTLADDAAAASDDANSSSAGDDHRPAEPNHPQDDAAAHDTEMHMQAGVEGGDALPVPPALPDTQGTFFGTTQLDIVPDSLLGDTQGGVFDTQLPDILDSADPAAVPTRPIPAPHPPADDAGGCEPTPAAAEFDVSKLRPDGVVVAEKPRRSAASSRSASAASDDDDDDDDVIATQRRKRASQKEKERGHADDATPDQESDGNSDSDTDDVMARRKRARNVQQQAAVAAAEGRKRKRSGMDVESSEYTEDDDDSGSDESERESSRSDTPPASSEDEAEEGEEEVAAGGADAAATTRRGGAARGGGSGAATAPAARGAEGGRRLDRSERHEVSSLWVSRMLEIVNWLYKRESMAGIVEAMCGPAADEAEAEAPAHGGDGTAGTAEGVLATDPAANTPLMRVWRDEKAKKTIQLHQQRSTLGRQGFFTKGGKIVRAETLARGGVPEARRRVQKSRIELKDETSHLSRGVKGLLGQYLASFVEEVGEALVGSTLPPLLEQNATLTLATKRGEDVDIDDMLHDTDRKRDAHSENYNFVRFLQYGTVVLSFMRVCAAQQRVPVQLHHGSTELLKEDLIARAFEMASVYGQVYTLTGRGTAVRKVLGGENAGMNHHICVSFLKEAMVVLSSLLMAYAPRSASDTLSPVYTAARALGSAVLHDQARMQALVHFMKVHKLSKFTKRYRAEMVELVHVSFVILEHIARDGRVYLKKKTHRRRQKPRRRGKRAADDDEEDDESESDEAPSLGDIQSEASSSIMSDWTDEEDLGKAYSPTKQARHDQRRRVHEEKRYLRAVVRGIQGEAPRAVYPGIPLLFDVIKPPRRGFNATSYAALSTHAPGAGLRSLRASVAGSLAGDDSPGRVREASAPQAAPLALPVQRTIYDDLAARPGLLLLAQAVAGIAGADDPAALVRKADAAAGPRGRKRKRAASDDSDSAASEGTGEDPDFEDDEAESVASLVSVEQDRITSIESLWMEFVHPKIVQTYLDTLLDWQTNSESTNYSICSYLNQVAFKLKLAPAVLSVEAMNVYERVLSSLQAMRAVPTLRDTLARYDVVRDTLTALTRKWFEIQRRNPYWVALCLGHLGRYEADQVQLGAEMFARQEDAGQGWGAAEPAAKRVKATAGTGEVEPATVFAADVPVGDADAVRDLYAGDMMDLDERKQPLTDAVARRTARYRMKQWTPHDDTELTAAWDTYAGCHGDGFIDALRKARFKHKTITNKALLLRAEGLGLAVPNGVRALPLPPVKWTPNLELLLQDKFDDYAADWAEGMRPTGTNAAALCPHTGFIAAMQEDIELLAGFTPQQILRRAIKLDIPAAVAASQALREAQKTARRVAPAAAADGDDVGSDAASAVDGLGDDEDGGGDDDDDDGVAVQRKSKKRKEKKEKKDKKDKKRGRGEAADADADGDAAADDEGGPAADRKTKKEKKEKKGKKDKKEKKDKKRIDPDATDEEGAGAGANLERAAAAVADNEPPAKRARRSGVVVDEDSD